MILGRRALAADVWYGGPCGCLSVVGLYMQWTHCAFVYSRKPSRRPCWSMHAWPRRPLPSRQGAAASLDRTLSVPTRPNPSRRRRRRSRAEHTATDVGRAGPLRQRTVASWNSHNARGGVERTAHAASTPDAQCSGRHPTNYR